MTAVVAAPTGRWLFSRDRIVSGVASSFIERNNLHVELIRHRNLFDFIHVYFCEAADSMQYRPPEHLYQEFLNTKHFGSVSNSLGQLAAPIQCIAS